jgi:hypothetical protein
MAPDGWVLGAPLKVLRQEDHVAQERSLATLGRHELRLQRVAGRLGPACEVFLDGRRVFQVGMEAPAPAWFDLCRELGFEPAQHWDWDPALILFQQVVPALSSDWHEPALPLDDLGLPEGVLSLAGLRQAFAEVVVGLHGHLPGPLGAKVVETFEWLPLRAVVFHDEGARSWIAEDRGPQGPVSLWLGLHHDRPVVIHGRRATPQAPCAWEPPEALRFLDAAGLEPEPPEGFDDALRATLARLCADLEAPLDAYRRTYPAGIPWHHGRRERLLGRTIVDLRPGDPPMLVLDDGSEVAIEPDPSHAWLNGGI